MVQFCNNFCSNGVQSTYLGYTLVQHFLFNFGLIFSVYIRCYRSFWKKAGKNIEGFPIDSNSRHLRKSGNALIHTRGSASLKENAPELLNHQPETNRRYYKSMVRGELVGNAKAEWRRLRKEMAAETDSDISKCELKYLTLAFLSNYLVISNVNAMAD